MINTGDRFDYDPLHVAAMKGFLQVLKILIENEADVDSKNEEEQTPLHLAADSGRTNCVRELLNADHSAANDEDENSNTPLHLAALSGHSKVANLLLNNGADVSASSDEDEFEGFTPEDVIQSIEKGAQLQQINDDELSDISFDEGDEDESQSESGSDDSEDEWTDALSQIDLPVFTESVGPTTAMTADRNELDFLNLMFPTVIFEILVAQTNLYAKQLQEKAGKPDTQWSDTTVVEMKAYIGIRLYMSILQLPTMEMYWSKDFMFGNLFVPNIMPRDRFDKLCQYFHANDKTTNPPRGIPGHDCLHHVRTILEIVNKNCIDNYKPHQNTSVDEAMIAFRGRLGFRQYLLAKPTKYGIKVWMRADSENGYCNEFDIYTGKTGDTQNHELGLTSRVVVNLTRRLENKNHIVNIDNYFTSFDLFKILKGKKIYTRGTARSNRKNFPKALHAKCVKNPGEKKVVQRGRITAYAWKDKKVIFFLSSADDPTLDNLQVQCTM
ncbi:unnamed protein product [Mytilus coruscus]|uniref:PiggyBac transposable element-derived protein domain-containing protein n=1 Tax=Mytilus coruscus TaxID=42192 RepID=A0A6J8EKG3_MYTCO|nr:unnamed protein product [Mytilus coruscus]